MRGNSADALGNIRDARVTENLVVLLKDEDSEVRRKVLYALNKIGDVRSVEFIIPLLKEAAVNEQNQWTTASYAAQVLKYQLATPEGLAAVEHWRQEYGVKGI